MSGAPIPGVTIVIKGTTTGTITNMDGKYSIVITGKDTILVFSFIGFVTEEISVSRASSEINMTLIEEIAKLEEVVVIGYGTMKKSFLTSASSSISSSDMVDTRDAEEYSAEIRGLASVEVEVSSESISEEKVINESVKASLLTAGEINDFGKWDLWNDITASELNQYSKLWMMNTDYRYSVQVKSEQGFPVTGAKVTLVMGDKTIWQSITDNTGKAELWANPFKSDKVKDSSLKIVTEFNSQRFTNNEVCSFHKGVNIITLPTDCNSPKTIDIAFVVDATSSMNDEIQYLKAELSDIMKQLKDTLPEIKINLGCEFYRDRGDEYITKSVDLTSDFTKVIDFVKNNNSAGGGDEPEAVETALDTVINSFTWSENALTKVVFLILDAAPHNTTDVKENLNLVIQSAAKKGIRIVPITCSGIDKSAEYLMRTIALLTNGTYVFLTDDSGIGGSHIKPSTDKYTVELLNDLLIRLILQYSSTASCTIPIERPQSDTLILKTNIADINPVESDSVALIDSNKTENQTLKIENQKVLEWKCFPIPTTGIIHIQSENKLNDFYVCDVSGKIIIKHTISGENETTLDIAQYPMGVYYIRYEYEPDKWMTGRIILVR